MTLRMPQLPDKRHCQGSFSVFTKWTCSLHIKNWWSSWVIQFSKIFLENWRSVIFKNLWHLHFVNREASFRPVTLKNSRSSPVMNYFFSVKCREKHFRFDALYRKYSWGYQMRKRHQIRVQTGCIIFEFSCLATATEKMVLLENLLINITPTPSPKKNST